MAEQAAVLPYASPFMATEARAKLGAKLASIAPGDIDVFFFTNGGAEANENAIKIARSFTGRHKILARYRSYHGGTAGSMALTGDPRRWTHEPGMPGVVHVLDPHHGMGRPSDSAEQSLAMLEEIIQLEGPNHIAAFFLETVSGTNGILIPPDGYLEGVRELCTKYGILMVCDEVMAGFGRTGEWFAINHWKVVPDLMCMAKGLTSGYVPMGAVGMRRAIADSFKDKMFPGGLTYNSHTLAAAAALAVLDVYEQDDLIANAKRLGKVMSGLLQDLAAKHKIVGAARNIGLVRHRRAHEGCEDEGADGAIRRHVRRDEAIERLLPRGRALHLRPLAHVLHEPAAVHHRRTAARSLRCDRSVADEARSDPVAISSSAARQLTMTFTGCGAPSCSLTSRSIRAFR